MLLVHARLEQIKTWISIWQMSEDRDTLTKARRVARDQLTNSPSWSHVHGPIGATVLTLIETGWVPSQPSLWLHPANEECATLSTPEPYAVSSILDAYKQSLVDQEWKQAAKHFKSSGLELGEPSLAPLAQARKILTKRANSEKKACRDQARFGSAAAILAALDGIACGGATCGEKFSPARPCHRCGCKLETAVHRYYDCPQNSDEELLAATPAIPKTDFVTKQFKEVVPPSTAFEECIVFRDILPASRCRSLLEDLAVHTLGSIETAAQDSGTLFTDGAGGPKHIIESLRKDGSGAACVNLVPTADGSLVLASVGILFGNVPGAQSVPRSETFAAVLGLRHVGNRIKSWQSDASYCVQGASANRNDQMSQGKNGDLWCVLREQFSLNPDIAVSKVKAHLTLSHVLDGAISFESYLGNGLADLAAGIAADSFQQQQATIEYAQKSFSMCVLICLRLAAIEAHCWHVTSLLLVPVPTFDPLPVVEEAERSLLEATQTLRRSRHALYHVGRWMVCAKCQKRRVIAKAHLWPGIACIKQPAPGNPRLPDQTAAPACPLRGQTHLQPAAGAPSSSSCGRTVLPQPPPVPDAGCLEQPDVTLTSTISLRS